MVTEVLDNGLPYTFAKPPCSCATCTISFRDQASQVPPSSFSYSLYLTNEETQHIAAEYLKSITEDQKYLRTQWDLLGKTIASRWKKKSKDKRVEILNGANPSPFEKEWFPILFANKELNGSTEELDARKYRNNILLDYLNIDGLKRDPSNLLGLIQNRSIYGPERWAIHDNHRLHWAWNQGILDIDMSNLCMVMHGPRYGELAEWDARASHSGEIIGFPRGRLVLETQELLLKYLRRVVERLVEGIKEPDEDQLALPPFQLGLKKSGRIEFWSPYTNQPYSAPPCFDIDEMYEKATARKNAVGDHLMLLQTDSSCLRSLIGQAAQVYSPAHPIENIYHHTVMEIHDTIWKYWSWVAIAEACENVRTMERRFKDSIQAGGSLPSKYEQCLQELEILLESQVRLRSQALPMYLFSRPVFRQYFTLNDSNPDRIAFNEITHVSPTMDPLFYILNILPMDPESMDPRNFDMATKWAYLEDHLANTTNENAGRLDEALYENYTDYAAVQELYINTHYHLPAPQWLKELSSYNVDTIKTLGRPTVFRDQIEKILEEAYMLPRDHDAAKILARFQKTVDGYRARAELSDQTELGQFDEARTALSTFWDTIRRKRKAVFSSKPKLWSASDISEDLKIISADLETSYLDASVAKRKKLTDKIENNFRPSLGSGSLHTPKGSPSDEAPNTSKRNLKSKLKANPQNETSIPCLKTLSVQHDEEPQLKPIAIKPTTLRVLTMMFPFSSLTNTSEFIRWDDFVLAMQDVGFTARHVVGSQVAFFPPLGNERGWVGRINVQKPHPEAKFSRENMRVLGVRMERWFGWEWGMFVGKK